MASPQRCAPLGYLSGTPATHQPDGWAALLYFFGGMPFGKSAPGRHCGTWKALHSPSLGDEARAVYGVWQSTASYSSFLGIFVNLHKSSQHQLRPGPGTWRNPKLLNVHALILSQPC